MDPENLFVVGSELFLENFPQLVLFSCQLFDNLQKAGIFDASLKVLRRMCLLLAIARSLLENDTLSKFTMGLARALSKSPTLWQWT